MRLIDADALVFSRVRIAHEDGTIGGYNAVVMSSVINNAPTIDAVPVIRCRDCVHFMYEDKDSYYNTCPYMGEAQDTDYCSHGERKEE